jgi:hypothetical protein
VYSPAQWVLDSPESVSHRLPRFLSVWLLLCPLVHARPSSRAPQGAPSLAPLLSTIQLHHAGLTSQCESTPRADLKRGMSVRISNGELPASTPTSHLRPPHNCHLRLTPWLTNNGHGFEATVSCQQEWDKRRVGVKTHCSDLMEHAPTGSGVCRHCRHRVCSVRCLISSRRVCSSSALPKHTSAGVRFATNS